MYRCNNFDNYSTVSTMATSTASVLLTPDTPLTPTNNERVVLKLATSPTGATNVPVNVIVGGVAVPVYNKAGNILYGNELYNGELLKCYYGTNGADGEAHLIAVNVPSFNGCNCGLYR